MRPLNPAQRSMSLDRLVREFINGDETSWNAENDWLERNHPAYMAELRDSIRREGVIEPIRLCYDERRVIDGHHRVVAALTVGLQRVPVANAWTDDGWQFRAPDPRPSEATPCP